MKQPRGQAREQSILEVVLALLAEQGYERLTVDAVASRARASKATIYSRWPDKATMVGAALTARSLHQPSIDWLGGTLRDDLLAFIELCVGLAQSESLPAFISMLAASESEPQLAAVVRGSALSPRRRDCDQIVRRAVARGEFLIADAAEELFDLVMGKVIVRYVVESSPLDLPAQAAFIDGVVLPALRAQE